MDGGLYVESCKNISFILGVLMYIFFIEWNIWVKNIYEMKIN